MADPKVIRLSRATPSCFPATILDSDGVTFFDVPSGGSGACTSSAEKTSLNIEVDTTITHISPNDTIIIGFQRTSNFLVDWDDGSSEFIEFTTVTSNSTVTHQYSTGGIYNISITGCFAHRSSTGGDDLKIISIKQWGFNYLRNGFFLFLNCSNITSFPQGETLTLPGDVRSAFKGVNLSNFGKLNFSAVTNCSNGFENSGFDYDVSSFNMASCITMTNMFLGTSMSTTNVDALLIGWLRWSGGVPNILLKSNVSLHLGTTSFTLGGDAEDAFNYLVNTLNWTITIL